MPKVKIYRKKEWTTRFKSVELYLDGQKIGNIRYGETKEIDVTAGLHRLWARMNWFGSGEFQFTMFSKDIRTISIGRNKGFVNFILILILGTTLLHLYAFKAHKFGHIYPPLMIIFAGVLLTYLITIGRNAYLIIKEGIDN